MCVCARARIYVHFWMYLCIDCMKLCIYTFVVDESRKVHFHTGKCCFSVLCPAVYFVCRRSHLTQWFCILYFSIVCNLVGITYNYLSMQLIYNSFLMYSNLIEVFSIKMNWCSTFMSSPTLLQNLFPDSRERNDISNKLKHKLVRKTSKQVNGSSSRSCLEEPPLSGLFTKKVINPSTKFSALLILCFVEEKFLMLLSSW